MSHRPQTVRARTRLSLQTFEPRDCPACTVVWAGNTLYVLGDNTANTVVISDTGRLQNNVPELDVTADGTRTTILPNLVITRVVVQTLGGDDSVTYQPGVPGGTQAVKSVVLDLGSGNDIALLTVSRPFGDPQTATLPSPDFNLRLNGGSGDDAVAVQFGTLAGTNAMVRASLGAGDDTFAAVFTGPVTDNRTSTDKAVEFNVQGGAGNDSIDLEANGIPFNHHVVKILVQGGGGDDDIAANVALTDGPGTSMSVQLLGGDGDDQVSADLQNLSAGFFHPDRILLDGGAGDDDLSLSGSSDQNISKATVNGGSGFDVDLVTTTVPSSVQGCEFNL